MKGYFLITKQEGQTMWKQVREALRTRAIEGLPPGQYLKHKKWETLNRLRAGVVRSMRNRLKWKKVDSDLSECVSVQNDNTYKNVQRWKPNAN